VTICTVDESGNLLFLTKAGAAPLNTIEFAQKKARQAALYKIPSKDGAHAVKKRPSRCPRFSGLFPQPGRTPELLEADGQTIGGIAATGAKSEIDETFSQAALDAVFNKK